MADFDQVENNDTRKEIPNHSDNINKALSTTSLSDPKFNADFKSINNWRNDPTHKLGLPSSESLLGGADRAQVNGKRSGINSSEARNSVDEGNGAKQYPAGSADSPRLDGSINNGQTASDSGHEKNAASNKWQVNQDKGNNDGAKATRTDSKPANKDGGETQNKRSFFTEKYDPEKADKLLKDLGDANQETREKAQHTLENMGEPALDKLEKATKSSDLEVQTRASRAIETINKNTKAENQAGYLDKAKQLQPDIESLYKQADVRVSNDSRDNRGALRLDGPEILHGFQPTAPTPEMQKKFDKLLQDLDASGAGKKGFQEGLKDEREKFVQSLGGDKKENQENWEKYSQMSILQDAAKGAREYYAKALSASNNPADREKGVKLLTEQLERNKETKPSYGLAETAIKLGADRNPDFMKAFKNAGGDENQLNELKKLYRR